MAAGYLPLPTDKYGPCAEACQHKDCALTRELAAKVCGGCGKEIGFGTYYYDEGAGGLWHRVCMEIAIENEEQS